MDLRCRGTERTLRPMVAVSGAAAFLLLVVLMAAAPPGPAAGASGQAPFVRVFGASAMQDSTPPVAEAGDDFTSYVGGITTFNATNSSDNIAIVNYFWTFVETGPELLVGETATHVFSTAGLYEVTLNVTDAEGNWDTDTVNVTVVLDTTPPTARAGSIRQSGEFSLGDVTIYAGDTLTLNGSRSLDDQTQISSYSWNFTYAGQPVVLSGKQVQYQFSSPGTYAVTLTVTNGAGLNSNTTISVNVVTKPSWLSQNWLGLSVVLGAVAVTAVAVLLKIRRDKVLLTRLEKEKLGLRVREARKMWKTFRSNRLGFSGFVLLMMFFAMAAFAPFIATVPNPNHQGNFETWQPDWDNPGSPTFDKSVYTGFIHPLGTDNIGQDVFSMTVYGARASLTVGFAATLISIILGTSIGLTAGYFGKAADEILMRFTDYFLVLPWFPLMIVLMTVLGREFIFVILAIGVTSWPSTARIVRSQVLTVKERTFIERARAVGAGDAYIIRRHVFPNVLPLIFANTILLISNAIFSEAFLDFFGLGDPTVISWGTMLEAAYDFGAFDSGAWWWTLPPSLAIILCVLSFSLVGYALDDVFNPKLRKR